MKSPPKNCFFMFLQCEGSTEVQSEASVIYHFGIDHKASQQPCLFSQLLTKKQHISQRFSNHDTVKPPNEMAARQPVWNSFRSASLFFLPASAPTWVHINMIKCLQIQILKKTAHPKQLCVWVLCFVATRFNVAVKPVFAAGKSRNLEDRHINF